MSHNASPTEQTPSGPRSADEIQAWLVAGLARRMNRDVDDIPLEEPIVGLGLDSMQVVAFAAELEQWLGGRFVENPLFDHPTIAELSAYLAEQLRQGNTVWS